jgi:hypothetical protein
VHPRVLDQQNLNGHIMSAPARDPYALDNAFRPSCRGQMFGFMHSSGLWLVISAWYIAYYV